MVCNISLKQDSVLFRKYLEVYGISIRIKKLIHKIVLCAYFNILSEFIHIFHTNKSSKYYLGHMI